MATFDPRAGGPVLPPEIINEVIANINITDMTYPQIANLWVAACQVSVQFAQEIPKALGRKLLREIAIEYEIGGYKTDQEVGNFKSLSTGRLRAKENDTGNAIPIENVSELEKEVILSFTFCRFSDDGVTAFFEAYTCMTSRYDIDDPYRWDAPYISTWDVFFEALNYYNREHPGFAEGPNHLTYLRGVFNDVGLPGFTVDKIKRQIGLDWKDLFQKLFREDAHCTSELRASNLWDSSTPSSSSSVIDADLGAYVRMQRECRKRRFENRVARTVAGKDSPEEKDLPKTLYQQSLADYNQRIQWVLRVRTEPPLIGKEGEYSRLKYWVRRTYGKSEGSSYIEGQGEGEGKGDNSERAIGEENESDPQEGSHTNEGEGREDDVVEGISEKLTDSELLD
ncbi:MAG: hypothetical protein Q9195_003008 [Heterodermia aff. obscurata]